MATKINFLKRLVRSVFLRNCICSSGLFDKNGIELCVGHTIKVNNPSRSYQTHCGENIPFPDGSYTEPLEPFIETIYFTVRFSNGMFWADPVEEENKGRYGDDSPLFWLLAEYKTREDLINAFDSRGYWIDEDCPEDSDLEYLLSEYPPSTEEELMQYVSGCEVVNRG